MGFEFPMVPASAGPFWLFVVLGIIMLGVLVIFGGFAYSSRHTTFEIRPEGLQIKGTLYGRTIPSASLAVDHARVIDLTQDRDFMLGWRTNGAGLPGYAAGWFRLKNKQKVLAFVTDRRRTVYVPTNAGYAIMMSVADPDGFVRQLRETMNATAI